MRERVEKYNTVHILDKIVSVVNHEFVLIIARGNKR